MAILCHYACFACNDVNGLYFTVVMVTITCSALTMAAPTILRDFNNARTEKNTKVVENVILSEERVLANKDTLLHQSKNLVEALSASYKTMLLFVARYKLFSTKRAKLWKIFHRLILTD